MDKETKTCPDCGGQRDMKEAPHCWHCKDCPWAKCHEDIEPTKECKHEWQRWSDHSTICRKCDKVLVSPMQELTKENWEKDLAIIHRNYEACVKFISELLANQKAEMEKEFEIERQIHAQCEKQAKDMLQEQMAKEPTKENWEDTGMAGDFD